MKLLMLIFWFTTWLQFEALMNTRIADIYYNTSSYFSSLLRKNGFIADLKGYTFTEAGYAPLYINDNGWYSNDSEYYIVHSTIKKMLYVTFPHFKPFEIEEFYAFLKFGLKVIAETDIDETNLYTFQLCVNEKKSFHISSDLFSLYIHSSISFRTLGFSLNAIILTDLSYANLMSASIAEFKLSLLAIMGNTNAVINNNAIREIVKETRVDYHLKNYGKHVKNISFSDFFDDSVNFFLSDLERSKKIGFGINSKFGYIHNEHMIGLQNTENMKKTDSVNILFNASDFRSITPLLKNIMHEKDMKLLFSMFDMYLFKMNLQNNPNAHNHASFTKHNIENVSKSQTLNNEMHHFEFKFNDFTFKVSGSLYFTDASGKGGYYKSTECDFERMYIEYQKHIVKGISVILKQPVEDINYRTLLLHFMSVI